MFVSLYTITIDSDDKLLQALEQSNTFCSAPDTETMGCIGGMCVCDARDEVAEAERSVPEMMLVGPNRAE